MAAARESESPPVLGERPRRWWVSPLGWTLAAIYGGQLAPFFAGPLTECDHCVGNYLRFFPMVPGIVVGHWLAEFLRDTIPGAKALSSDLFRFLVPGVLVCLAVLVTTLFLTAKIRGRWRWAWLILLAALSAFNALAFSAALRA